MPLFAVYSQTQGPDGNGLLSPNDPALGGHGGNALTVAASVSPVLASGGFTPPDLMASCVVATVVLRTPQAGAATAAGSFLLKGTFRRNGNTVSQVGTGQSIGAELEAGLGVFPSARLVVDTSVLPNVVTVQCQGSLLSPALAWAWQSGPALSL